MNAIRRRTDYEKKAHDRLIKDQIKEHMIKLAMYLESIFLCTINELEGHGKKRLERDLEEFKKWYNELIAFYDLEDGDDMEFICLKKLREIGFDISLLGNTLKIEYSINGKKEKVLNGAEDD